MPLQILLNLGFGVHGARFQTQCGSTHAADAGMMPPVPQSAQSAHVSLMVTPRVPRASYCFFPGELELKRTS
jgi:hypothetical protein